MTPPAVQLERFRARCITYGQLLTVTRRPATQGGAVTTQSIYFIVQPKTIGDTSPVYVEGIVSGTQGNAYTFTCAGDEDVQAATDWVTYSGGDYRLGNVNADVVAGVSISLECTGQLQ